MSSKKTRIEVKKESPRAEQPIHPTTALLYRFPKNPLIKNPIAGNKGINQT